MNSHWFGRRTLILLLAFAGIVAILLAAFRPATSVLPPVMLFPASYQFPSPPVSLFARWVPPTPAWAWLWHLKEAVLGKIKPVEIDTDIITLSPTLQPSLGAATFDGPGSLAASRVRVWQLETAGLNALRQQLKTNSAMVFRNSPRIITGDGITASLFAGQTVVLKGVTNETGVRVTYGTHTQPELIDLTASLSLVEPFTNEIQVTGFQTNLDLKARFQVTNGIGIFLIQSFPDQTNRDPVGILLSIKR